MIILSIVLEGTPCLAFLGLPFSERNVENASTDTDVHIMNTLTQNVGYTSKKSAVLYPYLWQRTIPYVATAMLYVLL